MNTLLFLFASLFCIVILASDVIVLTPDNFYDVVNGDKHVLVEFYAPWCGHCKHLEPEYEILASALKSEKNVVIAKVDADAHKDIGGKFDVKGFPTLKFFPKGTSASSSHGNDYSGGRTAEDLLAYVNNEAGSRGRIKKNPSNVVVLTTSNFDEVVMKSDQHVLVEFYAPWCGHCKHLAPEYEKVATAFAGDRKTVTIAKVDCDAETSLGSRYGVTGFPTLKWFSKDSKSEPVSYEEGRDPQSFVDFINSHAGTLRNVDGSLKDTAGRIESLDSIASQFASKPSASLIKKAESDASHLTGTAKSNADVYIKLMRAIEKKGSDFVQQETSRVSRMLEGSLTPEKRDELQLRKNILKAFE